MRDAMLKLTLTVITVLAIPIIVAVFIIGMIGFIFSDEYRTRGTA